MTRTDLKSAIERIHRLRSLLAELDQELRSLRRYDPRTPGVQRRYCELLIHSAHQKQTVIHRAIDIYSIDVSRVRSAVQYCGPGDMRGRPGASYLDRDGLVRVEIGDEAFVSAARLGSTIAHEVEVHVNRHLLHGLYPSDDERLALIYEVEAYDYELANKDRFGLKSDDIDFLKRRRASCHRKFLEGADRPSVLLARQFG